MEGETRLKTDIEEITEDNINQMGLDVVDDI
jgi:hypothetical protein